MYSDQQGSKQSYFIHTLLNSFKGGLVASCQPVRGGALDRPDIVAAMAQACRLNTEGQERLKKLPVVERGTAIAE